MNLRLKTLPVLALAAFGLILGILIGKNVNQPRAVSATVLEPAKPISDFKLQRSGGNILDLDSLKDDWHLVFFGFTHCPDICPTTLATLSRVQQTMKQKGQRAPRLLFISVDPERDTPELSEKYAKSFSEDAFAATGTEAQLDGFARQLGIIYMKVWASDGDTYTMDHSSAVLLLNPDGALQAVFSAPLTVSQISADLDVIMDST